MNAIIYSLKKYPSQALLQQVQLIHYQLKTLIIGHMGNSKTGCAQKAAVWQNDGECSCSTDNYNVQKVRWKSVPLGGQGWTIAGRILSLGLSQLWHKGRQYSHDCIQAWVRCSQCSTFMYLTMEFSQKGKQLSWGRYSMVKSDSNACVQANVAYKFSFIKQKYDQMPNSGYGLCSYNCKDWARDLWGKL